MTADEAAEDTIGLFGTRLTPESPHSVRNGRFRQRCTTPPYMPRFYIQSTRYHQPNKMDPSREGFWKAIQIYITKQHIVNKRVSASQPLGYAELPPELNALATVDIVDALLRESGSPFASDSRHLRINGTQIVLQDDCGSLLQDLAQRSQHTSRFIVASQLFARNTIYFNNCAELVVLDFGSLCVHFLCITSASSLANCSAAIVPFRIQLLNDCIRIEYSSDALSAKPDDWLQSKLLVKLRNWSAQFGSNNNNNNRTTQNIDSHSLLESPEAYINLYNHLKCKYGLDMVAKWPEQTDAAKFVYEDVAIAAYLLLYWRQERAANRCERLQSFADLGCGNGLLVYILSSEGHPGYGIDLRKRGVWDIYPQSTVLKVDAIVPSDKHLYPDADWIIGNHSDELSPWIPVIAARSATTTRFFLLPCCAFEFSGSKFQRRNVKESQYHDFINYCLNISDVCGFTTHVDRLKIPSTKRICLIGSGRKDGGISFDENCDSVQAYIDLETKSVCANPQNAWSNSFKPRLSVECVRNCSKVDRSLQNDIVHNVFTHLLSKKTFADNGDDDDVVGARWNAGGQCSLTELVQIVQPNQLKLLKNECGGLQTLLKNHNQIFAVQKGNVRVRVPTPRSESVSLFKRAKNNNKSIAVKTKNCWFFSNHPDGCPLSNIECKFVHANESD